MVTPLYPFGHGLSYTTFSYSNFGLSSKKVSCGERVDITLTVTNTGKVAGEEVVQLYTCDEYASIPRPVKELKGYCRVALEPGQSRRITFHLPINMLAFYDEELNLVVEAGRIKVMLGRSSADICFEDEFEITGATKAKVGQRVFICPVTVQ
jgi:beta-glucosidase